MKVSRTIQRYAMFAPRDRVLVAVSGGPDSVALLHILHGLAGQYPIELGVAHLNHGLRPRNAEREAAYAARLARELKLAFHEGSARLDPDAGSLEERARLARYEFLHRMADRYGYAKIALGHHTDDNAEAVLLHMMRGSGIRGLSGIPPVRNGGIVRPLIQLRRDEILDYLRSNGITFHQDESNDDLRFERNRIRHRLIPLLEKEYNPNIVNTLQRTADLCWEEDRWLGEHLARHLNTLMTDPSPAGFRLDRHRLAALPRAMQRRLLRGALQRWQGHIRRIGSEHIDAVIDMLANDRAARRISLPNRWRVECTAGHLKFGLDRDRQAAEEESASDYEYRIEADTPWPAEFDLPGAAGRLLLHRDRAAGGNGIRTDAHSACFDLDLLTFPMILRNFRPGDRLAPYGMQGSQKLKNLFADRKIPRNRRRSIPLLVSDGQIVWVAGTRRSRLALVSPATTRVLVARWTVSHVGRGGPDAH